jgi:hypothetical protein
MAMICLFPPGVARRVMRAVILRDVNACQNLTGDQEIKSCVVEETLASPALLVSC